MTKIERIRSMKAQGQRIAALTAYDYPMGKLLDEAGVDVLLVGDSLGMVVLGYPNTTSVTMADMIHHTSAVARSKPKALLVADMPFKSYETPQQAVENARALIHAGAECVKAEGGLSILPQIKAILSDGIPVMGHLGMLPQHVLEEGGIYHVKGKVEAEREAILADARALDEAGVMSMVLELVKHDFTGEVTQAVSVPTIGIGSGNDCDGQILVTHDLVGSFPWFTPKFVKPILHTGNDIRQAVQNWIQTIR